MPKSKAKPSTKVSQSPPKLCPPTSLEGLRTLLISIARGNSSIVLSSKARSALGEILDLQGSPALLSITSLAKQVGITPSTITRLARNLGYNSFGAFQKALYASSSPTPSTFYLTQAQSALNSQHAPSKQQAAKLCHENQANIDRFINTFNSESFERAVDMISKARRVSVFGIRQFHSLATFLVYGLRLIRSDVSLLDANALGLAEELGSMNSGDICIVASVSPYSAPVVEAARIAAEIGIDVIAMTDRVSSPLVDHSKAALFVAHDSSFISNSITSYFAAAECLINAVASTNPAQSERALVERQNLIESFNIERS